MKLYLRVAKLGRLRTAGLNSVRRSARLVRQIEKSSGLEIAQQG